MDQEGLSKSTSATISLAQTTFLHLLRSIRQQGTTNINWENQRDPRQLKKLNRIVEV